MSDSLIIIPNAPPEPPDEGKVRYELGLRDGTGRTRYVSLAKTAKLSNYFDDMFRHVLEMCRANQGGVTWMLAHGIQCLWCFTAKNVSSVERSITVLAARVDDLHHEKQRQDERIRSLEAENAKLRDLVVDRR